MPLAQRNKLTRFAAQLNGQRRVCVGLEIVTGGEGLLILVGHDSRLLVLSHSFFKEIRLALGDAEPTCREIRSIQSNGLATLKILETPKLESRRSDTYSMYWVMRPKWDYAYGNSSLSGHRAGNRI